MLFWHFPLFWIFPLTIRNFPLLFSHSKNIGMSTLITNYYLLIIIIIIITKSHNDYCMSYGVMFIKFVDIDWLFFVQFLLLCGLWELVTCDHSHKKRKVRFLVTMMWLTKNHMFIREILGKFTSFMFWNFEISHVSLGRFQISKKELESWWQCNHLNVNSANVTENAKVFATNP